VCRDEAPNHVPLVRAARKHTQAWNENVERQRSTGRKVPGNAVQATAQIVWIMQVQDRIGRY